MSSNMYGFSCYVNWQDRDYNIQITYVGTSEDNPILPAWAEDSAAELAEFELDHRDWSCPRPKDVRIGMSALYPMWTMEDHRIKNLNPSYNPPCPTECDVLNIIASKQATEILYGWDT